MITDDIHEGRTFEYESDEENIQIEVLSMRSVYEKNKQKKVGEKINCANCKKEVIKTSYQMKFCCIKCKDKFWNFTDENRRARASLFS